MTSQLAELSNRLVTEGPVQVHADLVQLAERSRGTVPGASAVLADAGAPEVARLRAFSVVARHLNSLPNVDKVA